MDSHQISGWITKFTNFKEGDPKNLDDYIGITLFNSLCKVYEEILAKILSEINAKFNIIRKEQYGVIRGELELNTVASVVEICERRKEKN